MYYPVFLDLQGKEVLVVGAGKVALRKVRGLLEAGARVKVVSPEAETEFRQLEGVEWQARRFERSDVRGKALVFAATNDREVNRAVGEEAAALGIWANVADAPEEGGFIVPSRVRRGDLQVAVSTSGRSPRIAASLRERIAALLDEQNDRGIERW
jgi:siroheme synthase-like protein